VQFASEPLGDNHDPSGFDSGKPELDDWLRESARHAAAMNSGRTFVWHQEDGRIIAYFTLAAHLIARRDLPPKLGRGSPDAIPAVLLARLALDRSLHGQKLGGELLWDALSRTVAASRQAAARFVVVDALDAAAVSFYRHYGFAPLPDRLERLVQKMSSIEAALHR
jgi:predicted N-acetyltransferase YhbS